MCSWKRAFAATGIAVGIASCGGFSPEYREGPQANIDPMTASGDACPTGAPGKGATVQPAASAQTEQAVPQVSFADIEKIVKAKCVSCHAGANPPPTLKTTADIEAAVEGIKRTVAKGTMPPSGGMTAAEKKAIADWQPVAAAALALDGPVTYFGGIRDVVASQCLACHGMNGQAPVLTTFALVRKAIDDVIQEVEAGTMPTGGALPPEQSGLFRLWKDGGFALGDTGAGTGTTPAASPAPATGSEPAAGAAANQPDASGAAVPSTGSAAAPGAPKCE